MTYGIFFKTFVNDRNLSLKQIFSTIQLNEWSEFQRKRKLICQ